MFSLCVEAEGLTTRLIDCIDHLRAFPNDQDACTALQRALEQLASGAAETQGPIAAFARALAAFLARDRAELCLRGDALLALKQCVDLLSWQVELNDPRHGLAMDCSEQRELLATLAGCCPPDRTHAPLA
ncbi:hypothetical protein [Pseudomonas japonica]|uniref:hypothetical protein n=1 Tax=Pseudomonas japonica TaxID=256466 RepID=UPI0015E36BCA|nr:hypothetical protein [Pseudomonas japonica]MBA1242657.1 hypothetical protein [Pseudomonas japonica]MBA1289112.1 hypothetical protein [Pseudomonas japonica]